MPVVPSYGGDEEYSPQRQLTWQPTRGAWPTAAPRGLRPIGGNVYAGIHLGQKPGGGRAQGNVRFTPSLGLLSQH